ncbi:MAG: UDP-N-acetylmuramoyl-tripeptide--D-alanyl-D-alanine ligase [Chlamydiales bacterium]|nr:UDP-N-acetylmuramoyl-tripeptide--D-alanyl-D-alanine ligase [Chlamydiales bacterium]
MRDMKPISFSTLAQLLDLNHTNQTLVKGVAIDSRKVKPGDLFFALPGNRVDGHDYLEEIAAKGAAGAVVSETYRGPAFNIPLLHVPDVLEALQDMARKSLEKRQTKVIAISGSLGKTTVKDFAATLIGAHFHVFASPESYNSQATVPLSILMADETEDYLILEMGMSHAGHLKKLISIAPPDIALLSTVAVQHAANFSDGLAGISREKASLFSHPKTELGIFHRDIHYYDEVYQTGACPKMTFSTTSKEADYYLELIEDGVKISHKGEAPVDIPLSLPNPAHYQNFLAAVCLARAVGVEWSVIQKAAPLVHLPSMRFEKVMKEGIVFINDAYNANPDSMKAALENLPQPEPGGKTIAVLSEMDALGMYTEGAHAQVAETALHHADLLLCVGSRCETMHKIWKREKRAVELFENRADLQEGLKACVRTGDVVLLKGARSYALDQLLHAFCN